MAGFASGDVTCHVTCDRPCFQNITCRLTHISLDIHFIQEFFSNCSITYLLLQALTIIMKSVVGSVILIAKCYICCSYRFNELLHLQFGEFQGSGWWVVLQEVAEWWLVDGRFRIFIKMFGIELAARESPEVCLLHHKPPAHAAQLAAQRLKRPKRPKTPKAARYEDRSQVVYL